MKNYIGTKQLKAEPLNLGDYNVKRGWQIPANEDPLREGYFVEYPDGYVSWSPKEVFEEAYKETSGLTFGLAVELAKKGQKISRTGWNGSGMYVVIMPGYPEGIPANTATAKTHNISEGTVLKFRPYFQLKTAQDDIAMWAPSGSDALAEDWLIVE